MTEKTILAVDDSATIREMVALTLGRGNYRVITAQDGMDALEKLKDNQVELVITDHYMPRMDGLTLVQTLRSQSATQTIPILILTTETSPEMKQKGRQAGATGWIVKPFHPKTLTEVVKKLIG